MSLFQKSESPDESILIPLTTPMSKSWRLLYELCRKEVNESITATGFLHREFQKHLWYIRNECHEGHEVLDNIYAELNLIRKNEKLDEANTQEIEANLGKLLELFGSSHREKLKLKTLTTFHKDYIDQQEQTFEVKKKPINRIASISSATAGFGFAGFAAALCASAKMLLQHDLKSSLLLGVSGGGLAVASLSHLADYFEYDDFDSILHDLAKLKMCLTSLFVTVETFGNDLAKLVEEIKSYTTQTKGNLHILLYRTSGKLFMEKLFEIMEKTATLQVSLMHLETHTKKNFDCMKKIKAEELPKKKTNKNTP